MDSKRVVYCYTDAWMLHVKQCQLLTARRQGENYWHGKHIDASTEYMDEPWEIEAYVLEHGLAKAIPCDSLNCPPPCTRGFFLCIS